MSDPRDVVKKVVMDFWTHGKRELIPELYQENYTRNDTHGYGVKGHGGIGEFFDEYKKGVPDLSFDMHDMFTVGNKVVVRYSMKGTHKGKVLNLKATNREFTVEGSAIFNVENGKVVEDWHNYDMLAFLQALDALPRDERLKKQLEDFSKYGARELISQLDHENNKKNGADVPAIEARAENGESFDEYKKAVPDLRFHVEDKIMEGNKLAVRYWMQGTHTGKLLNLDATNREFTIEGITIFHLKDGKVDKDWHNIDTLTFLQALDALPSLDHLLQDQHEDD